MSARGQKVEKKKQMEIKMDGESRAKNWRQRKIQTIGNKHEGSPQNTTALLTDGQKEAEARRQGQRKEKEKGVEERQ